MLLPQGKYIICIAEDTGVLYKAVPKKKNVYIRRGRDSNPRTPFDVCGFQDRRLQPDSATSP